MFFFNMRKVCRSLPQIEMDAQSMCLSVYIFNLKKKWDLNHVLTALCEYAMDCLGQQTILHHPTTAIVGPIIVMF